MRNFMLSAVLTTLLAASAAGQCTHVGNASVSWPNNYGAGSASLDADNPIPVHADAGVVDAGAGLRIDGRDNRRAQRIDLAVMHSSFLALLSLKEMDLLGKAAPQRCHGCRGPLDYRKRDSNLGPPSGKREW